MDIKVHDRFNPPATPGLTFADQGKTHAEFREVCDINNIMAGYRRTGRFEHVSTAIAQFGDFSHVPDYATALEAVQAAQNTFLAQPARVRAEFGNDPARFVQFCTDPANADRLVELGLATREDSNRPTLPVAEVENPGSTEPPVVR